MVGVLCRVECGRSAIRVGFGSGAVQGKVLLCRVMRGKGAVPGGVR